VKLARLGLGLGLGLELELEELERLLHIDH
jgi:hypothetical protein